MIGRHPSDQQVAVQSFALAALMVDCMEPSGWMVREVEWVQSIGLGDGREWGLGDQVGVDGSGK